MDSQEIWQWWQSWGEMAQIELGEALLEQQAWLEAVGVMLLETALLEAVAVILLEMALVGGLFFFCGLEEITKRSSRTCWWA